MQPYADWLNARIHFKSWYLLLILSLGNGYITTNTLKEILREIDSTLNEHNLDQIVDEVDEDGSGTIDFDEFMAMMTGE